MFNKGDNVYCSHLKKAGVVSNKKPYTWLYNVTVEFEDGSTSVYTFDGRFSVDRDVCLKHIFVVGDKVRDTKGRYGTSVAEVVGIDNRSDFPLKVSNGKVQRSYTLDGRYDYNSPIELVKEL